MLMNKNSYARACHLAKIFLGTAFGLGCIIVGLRQNMNLFITPGYLVSHAETLQNKPIRLGAKVKKGSIKVAGDKLHFQAYDPDTENSNIHIVFAGVPPSLFKEETWIIAEGQFSNNTVLADRILAKHDESYQPQGMQRAGRVG